jgi:hypothetical protein
MEHNLFIVARAKYLRHDVQLMGVILGGLGQLRCDVEFLILVESQTCCVRGLQLLREQILHHKHIVGLHTRDAARTPCYAVLGMRPLSCSHAENISLTTRGQFEYDSYGWCNKSQIVQPSDLVLDI